VIGVIMPSVFVILAFNSVSITMAIVAGVLALKEKEGWGWFLFAALLTFGSRAMFAGSTP
jgi:hypothetical protein